MKLKATYKSIRESNQKILRLGYCEAQTLLRYKDAFAYSCGTYGWNCDYYDINGVIVSTGYRPIGDYSIAYKTLKEYEDKAEAIAYNNAFDYETQKEIVNGLLEDMVKEATAV
jgi:hypothetical protein